MSAVEQIIQGLNQQTYAERMEMAAYLGDMISDFFADGSDLPTADDVAGWLETLADNYLTKEQ